MDAGKRNHGSPATVKVRVYGNVALVTEQAAISDVLEGERRDVEIRLTHMWVKRDGRWQVVARHGTRIAEPQQNTTTTTRSQLGTPSDSALSSLVLDAVRVDPKHYKIEFENDRVRVVRVQYGPHEKSVVMHELGNSVGIYLTDFHSESHFPGRGEVDAKAGRTMWRAPALKHISTENLSDQPLEALWVESKPAITSAKAGAGYDSKAEQEVTESADEAGSAEQDVRQVGGS